MLMNQSLLARLETSEDERKILLETMGQYNVAANYLAVKAYELKCANKYELQKIFYRELRERFRLSAQFAIRVISKVVEAYKRDRTKQPRFKPLGAIQYDQRILSWKGLDRVSITSLKGRLKLPVRLGNYQKARMNRIRGQADLFYRNKQFYLVVVVDAPEEPPYEPKGVLGVDLGIVNLATDSDGDVFRGDGTEKARKDYASLRARLQNAGTRSAKRHLKKLSGRERRFKRNVNHCISKALVAKAKGTQRMIALEDLKGIRVRATVRRRQRDKHNKWAFNQLRNFIEYKAKLASVPIAVVDPRNTSRICPRCLTLDRRNRLSRDKFQCTTCRFEGEADYVAALNIARAAINQPIVAGEEAEANVGLRLIPATISLPLGGRS